MSSQVKSDNVPQGSRSKEILGKCFEICWFTLNPVRMLGFELRVKSISPMLSGRIAEEMAKIQIKEKLDSRKGKRGEEKDKGNGEEKNKNAGMCHF